VCASSCDISRTAIAMIRDLLKTLPQTLADMERLMNRNRIFVNRTSGIGLLSRAEAINRSCSGPVARASGVTRDLRKDEPYLAYKDFDFNVCCAEAGDCFARYLVRMGEMRESIKIIHQALENLPEGPVNVGDLRSASETPALRSRVILPEKSKVYSTIEGLITHFELVMTNRGFPTPSEEVYCATEAPNGELGFYIVGDGSPRAYRARCRPPRSRTPTSRGWRRPTRPDSARPGGGSRRARPSSSSSGRTPGHRRAARPGTSS